MKVCPFTWRAIKLHFGVRSDYAGSLAFLFFYNGKAFVKLIYNGRTFFFIGCGLKMAAVLKQLDLLKPFVKVRI